jgi:hypothetical protein
VECAHAAAERQAGTPDADALLGTNDMTASFPCVTLPAVCQMPGMRAFPKQSQG